MLDLKRALLKFSRFSHYLLTDEQGIKTQNLSHPLKIKCTHFRPDSDIIQVRQRDHRRL